MQSGIHARDSGAAHEVTMELRRCNSVVAMGRVEELPEIISMARKILYMIIRPALCLLVVACVLSYQRSNAQISHTELLETQDEFSVEAMLSYGVEGKPCPSPSKYDSLTHKPLNRSWQAGPDREEEERDILDGIHSEMFRSPKMGLKLLVREIQQELRVLAAVMGLMENRTGATIPESAQLLNTWSAATRDFTEPCVWFWESANSMFMERNNNPDEVRKVAELGINALKKARAYPRNVHVVYCTGIPLYSDSNASVRIPGAHGIVLGVMDMNGQISDWRIYITTRTHYVQGMQVSWNWNMGTVYGEIWYRDPNTNEIRQAYSSSAEFAGRDLREL